MPKPPMLPLPCRMLSSHRERVNTIAEWLSPHGTSEVPISLAHLSMVLSDIPESHMKLGLSEAIGDSKAAHTMAISLGALASWQRSQFIFDFDVDMWDALGATRTDVMLDAELLRRMPAPCIWVEIPMRDGRGDNNGFFAVFDRVDDDNDPELRGRQFCVWLIMVENGPDVRRAFSCQAVILGLGLSLEESMARTYVSLEEGERRRTTALLAPIVSALLYLCSEEPEVEGAMSRMNRQRQARRQPLYGPTVFRVGARLGALFRKARAEHEAAEARGEHDSPLPHMRRAHWHAYWLGPRSQPEARRRVLKWLHPIAVNAAGADIQAAVRPVKNELGAGGA